MAKTQVGLFPIHVQAPKSVPLPPFGQFYFFINPADSKVYAKAWTKEIFLVSGTPPVPQVPVTATGRYNGAGGLQSIITGLTLPLKAVQIYCSPSVGPGQGVYFGSDSMNPGDWRDASGNVGIGLTLSGSDFSVTPGTGDGPNQVGVVYDWIAYS